MLLLGTHIQRLGPFLSLKSCPTTNNTIPGSSSLVTEDIKSQFSLGLKGLFAPDHHYINQGLAHIHSLPAGKKKARLRGIRIAREIYLASEARELESMRTFLMLHWLSPA
jgi:hypothetical protein